MKLGSTQFMTSENVIEHYKWRGIECPVAIKTMKDEMGRNYCVTDEAKGGRPIPDRDEKGNLVFALPGGGRLYSDRKI